MTKGPFTQPKPLSIIIIVFQSLNIILKQIYSIELLLSMFPISVSEPRQLFQLCCNVFPIGMVPLYG